MHWNILYTSYEATRQHASRACSSVAIGLSPSKNSRFTDGEGASQNLTLVNCLQ